MQHAGMSKRESGVFDTAPELGGGEPARFQFPDDLEGEVEAILGAGVGESLLGSLPDALVGVEFGRVGGKVLEVEARNPAAEGRNGFASMHPEAVPDHDERLAKMAEEVTQERDDLPLADVVMMPLIVEAESAALGADGDPGDNRDPIMTLPVPQKRRLPARRPGARDCRRQLEARLVDEDEIGPQPKGVFFTWGQRTRFQRSIAASFRSRARRSGFWQLQPHWPRSRPTWSR